MSTNQPILRASQPQLTATERGSRRYETIDTLRGIALMMMVASHTTNDRLTTVIGKVTHTDRWVGGAAFFVMLSGVVVGIVHRRLVDSNRGFDISTRKLLRRAALIYAIQVALVTLMVTVESFLTDSHIAYVASWPEIGGVPLGLVRIGLFRVQPIDVLPMYVVFLLATIPMIRLLAKRKYLAFCALSGAVYVVSQFVDLAFSPGGFSVGAWQVLFFGGLVTGWIWEHERLLVPERVRHSFLVICAATTSVMLVVSNFAHDRLKEIMGQALEKQAGGWMAFLYGVTLVVTYYVVVQRARRVRLLLPPLRVVETIGAKTLPAYTAMCVAIIALAPVPVSSRNDLVVLGVLLVTGAGAVVGLRFDAWLKCRRRGISLNRRAV